MFECISMHQTLKMKGARGREVQQKKRTEEGWVKFWKGLDSGDLLSTVLYMCLEYIHLLPKKEEKKNFERQFFFPPTFFSFFILSNFLCMFHHPPGKTSSMPISIFHFSTFLSMTAHSHRTSFQVSNPFKVNESTRGLSDLDFAEKTNKPGCLYTSFSKVQHRAKFNHLSSFALKQLSGLTK